MLAQQILGNYGPSLAALLMLALFGKRGELKDLLARLRPRRAHLRWVAVALLVPLVVLLPGLLTYAGLGGSVADLPWGAIAPSFVLALLISGLGEELGWRGYALPRLQARAGPFRASVIVGAVWAFWHLPVFCWTSTQTGLWLLIEYVLFTLVLVAYSVVLAWVYNAAGRSLWLAVLLHAAVTATGNNVLVALSPGRAGTWVPYLVYVLSACGAALLVALPGRAWSRPKARRARGQRWSDRQKVAGM